MTVLVGRVAPADTTASKLELARRVESVRAGDAKLVSWPAAKKRILRAISEPSPKAKRRGPSSR